MVTALTSMALGRPVRGEVGMTGEVTLNGRVLPIGGAKQKLLAAQRAGLTTVFLPQRNEPDLDDVPAEVLEEIEVVLSDDVAELVAARDRAGRSSRLRRWPPEVVAVVQPSLRGQLLGRVRGVGICRHDGARGPRRSGT